jgi:hypothetical protein
MLNLRRSSAAGPSSGFTEALRQEGENNVAWVARQLAELGEQHELTGVYLVLLGGTQVADFRLRVAQSHLRDDMSPSYWSHVALCWEMAEDMAQTVLCEIALQPDGGFGFPPPTNAVQRGYLAAYEDERRWPNIALVHVPVSPKAVAEAMQKFQKQRATLDAVELVIEWLAFVWGAGRAGNPLLTGSGIPSAAMIEVVIGAAGYDITPGLESRASCPEAIWQAAKWWHEYYADQKKQAPFGAWSSAHNLIPGGLPAE